MSDLTTGLYTYISNTSNDVNSFSSSVNEECSSYVSDSIFTSAAKSEADTLRAELNEVKKEQGVIGKLWNGFKNLTGLGLSSDNVEENIEAYENGELTYEEAINSIESYKTKQDNMVDLIANVISGIATGAAAIGTAGISLIAGALIGGSVKAGIKTLDRATNDIEGDALNAKQIAKDTITGAADGVVNAATAGMFEGITSAGQTVKQAAVKGIKAGAISGAASGAVSGAASYTTEAVFEEDVDFDIEGLITSTAQNAAAGAVFGGITGGITGGLKQNSLNKKVKISRNKTLGAKIDNTAQAEEYIKNYNDNNKNNQIAADKTDEIMSELKELSKKSEELAQTFDSQIDEATEQINKVFSDKNDIELVSGRAKGQKSVFSKLARKDISGDLANLDTDTCYVAIGDALGTRVQMKSLNMDEASDIVKNIFKEYNIEANVDDFVQYIQNPETTQIDDTLKSAFSSVKTEVIDALKTRQTQSTVDQLVEGIKNGTISITEINNYGDELTSYFTNKQLAEIIDGCKYAYENQVNSIDTVTVVNKSNISANCDIDNDGVVEDVLNVKQVTGKAEKTSGYSTSQMNTKHALENGATGNGELQIRGAEVNGFAEVEHIPYDIRTGKITTSEAKFNDVIELVKNMSDDLYSKYNQYLSDTYSTLRLKELGLLSSDSSLPVLSIEELDQTSLDLLSYEGLKKILEQ